MSTGNGCLFLSTWMPLYILIHLDALTYPYSPNGLQVICTDTLVSQQASAAAINRNLYCGYSQARCNGSSIIQEYAAAWDFGASSLGSFSVNAWYNGTGNSNGGGQGPGTNYRLPGLVNMASKAWWMNFMGNITQSKCRFNLFMLVFILFVHTRR